MASEGLTDQEVSARPNMHYGSVGGWCSRFLEVLPHLQEVRGSTPDKLPDEVREIFLGRPRPGCSCAFTQGQIMKVIDLVCKAPSGSRYEVSQQNLNLLAKKIRKQGIVQDISAKSVSRLLKGSQIRTP